MSSPDKSNLITSFWCRVCAKMCPQQTTVAVPPIPSVPAPVPAVTNSVIIDVINSATVVTDEQLKPIVDAVQNGIGVDFAPVWGINATLNFLGKGATPDPKHWWAGIFDTSDDPGALGYHDVTDAGYPLAKIFWKTTMEDGDNPSVTLDHEIKEMLGDPDINLLVLDPQSRVLAYENCDPCERDEQGYVGINGVHLSDFVYPHYFSLSDYGPPYDKTGQITKQWQILPGGYQLIFENGKWTQIEAKLKRTSQEKNWRNRPLVGSRRFRRMIPTNQRVRSTVLNK